MLSLMNIFLKSTGKKFEDFTMKAQDKTRNFSIAGFTMGKMDDAGRFVADGFKKRRFENRNGEKFSKFLELTGKDKK